MPMITILMMLLVVDLMVVKFTLLMLMVTIIR